MSHLEHISQILIHCLKFESILTANIVPGLPVLLAVAKVNSYGYPKEPLSTEQYLVLFLDCCAFRRYHEMCYICCCEQEIGNTAIIIKLLLT